MENKKYKFNVCGTHCKSCAILIEKEVSKIEGIDNISFNFHKSELEICSTIEKDGDELLKVLNDAISGHGYYVSKERSAKRVNWEEFIYAIPLSLAIISVFSFIQRSGLIDFLGNDGNLSFSSVFLLGVIASLSSCLAVVGGLVLSLSANYAKEGGDFFTQTLFHTGRLVGFFILGGAIGILGGSFYVTAEINFVMGIILSFVMFILGLNLLDVFEKTKNFQIIMPKFFAKKVFSGSESKNYLAPIIIGAATFFLPCGFTQSMQLYALSVHDFWKGGLIMFVFALGTLPVLAILSFSSFSINNKNWSGIFYKTVGIIIMFLSLFNFIGAMSSYGIIEPVFNL